MPYGQLKGQMSEVRCQTSARKVAEGDAVCGFSVRKGALPSENLRVLRLPRSSGRWYWGAFAVKMDLRTLHWRLERSPCSTGQAGGSI